MASAALLTGSRADNGREAEVRRVIAMVRDPEIDETIAALDFIVGVSIEDDIVEVSLRLPTFWCPANFVYLMGEEMRTAIAALPWARGFRLKLVDHFAADEINRGITDGLEFADVFPAQARGDLVDLRRTFAEKAFLMRQGELISYMTQHGLTDAFLLNGSVDEFERLANRQKGELQTLWDGYLEKRAEIGLSVASDAIALTDADGAPVPAAGLTNHIRQIRKVTTSARANGEMCRILMASKKAGFSCSAMHAGDGDTISMRGNR